PDNNDLRFGSVNLLLTLRPDAALLLLGASDYEEQGVSFDPPKLTVPLWGIKEAEARKILAAFHASGDMDQERSEANPASKAVGPSREVLGRAAGTKRGIRGWWERLGQPGRIAVVVTTLIAPLLWIIILLYAH